MENVVENGISEMLATIPFRINIPSEIEKKLKHKI
jgi:hypothetical protein